MKQNLALPLDQLDTSIQQYFLEQFLDFERKGKIIKSLQSSINTDSAGIGKDLFYANEKQNQVLALNTKSNVANAHELIGEYLTLFEGQGEPRSFEKGEDRVREIHKLWYNRGLREGEKRKLVDELIDMGYMPVTTALAGGRYTPTISFIKPTTINGFASVYALLLNNKLWEK